MPTIINVPSVKLENIFLNTNNMVTVDFIFWEFGKRKTFLKKNKIQSCTSATSSSPSWNNWNFKKTYIAKEGKLADAKHAFGSVPIYPASLVMVTWWQRHEKNESTRSHKFSPQVWLFFLVWNSFTFLVIFSKPFCSCSCCLTVALVCPCNFGTS